MMAKHQLVGSLSGLVMAAGSHALFPVGVQRIDLVRIPELNVLLAVGIVCMLARFLALP